MDSSIGESNIIVTSLVAFVTSNNFFEIDLDKCKQIIWESYSHIIKDLENIALSIDTIDELEIMEMVDVAKVMCDMSTKIDAFLEMMKEFYHDHYFNKGHNTILIIEEYVTQLHHYGEMFFLKFLLIFPILHLNTSTWAYISYFIYVSFMNNNMNKLFSLCK